MGKLALKFTWNLKGLRINSNLIKEEQGLKIDSRFLVSKVTGKKQVTKTVWSQHKTGRDRQNRPGSPKGNTCICGCMTFYKDAKAVQQGENSLVQPMVLRQSSDDLRTD